MSIITDINKAFDHRIRLGIMSVLMVNESASFKELKEYDKTHGTNVAEQLKKLGVNPHIHTIKKLNKHVRFFLDQYIPLSNLSQNNRKMFVK